MELPCTELGKVAVETFLFLVQNNQLDARGGSSGKLGLRYIDGGFIDINVLFKATSLLETAHHWRAEGRRAEDAGLGHPNRMPLARERKKEGKPRIFWVSWQPNKDVNQRVNQERTPKWLTGQLRWHLRVKFGYSNVEVSLMSWKKQFLGSDGGEGLERVYSKGIRKR